MTKLDEFGISLIGCVPHVPRHKFHQRFFHGRRSDVLLALKDGGRGISGDPDDQEIARGDLLADCHRGDLSVRKARQDYLSRGGLVARQRHLLHGFAGDKEFPLALDAADEKARQLASANARVQSEAHAVDGPEIVERGNQREVARDLALISAHTACTYNIDDSECIQTSVTSID